MSNVLIYIKPTPERLALEWVLLLPFSFISNRITFIGISMKLID